MALPLPRQWKCTSRPCVRSAAPWPAWSPDGQRITFAANRNGKDYQIFVMGTDGSDVRLLADTHGRGTSPKWSPDGRSIYFTNCLPEEGGGGCEIMVVPLEAVRQEGR